MEPVDSPRAFRFGDYELDVSAYELRRHGQATRLERRPMELLLLLVERRGQLVTRADIIERLWSQDVVVDFDTGVNTAIRKIRQALHDSPHAPGFVQTVAGKGYRFIATVDVDAVRENRAPIRVAVLPFQNLSADATREYVADGLTEETIASLGRIDPEHLRVIGRTSTMAYKHTTHSAAAVGRELRADFLVEGSVRYESERLRIIAALMRVRDQTRVWSASYDREPTSLLDVQQELSTSIAEQIRLRLSPERVVAMSRRQTRNVEAYELYLKARRLWHQLEPATTRMALEHLRMATELDPDYALAWAGIAEAYASSPINGDHSPTEAWSRARDAAGQAVRADPNLVETQHALGQLNWMLEWNWPAAEAAFRHALALDASFAWSHSMLGHVLSQCGRHADAHPFMSRARELDPLAPVHYAMSSQVSFQAREYATALAHADRAIAIDPRFWIGHMMRGQALERLDDPTTALESLSTAARLSVGNSKPVSLQGYILGRMGQVAEAHQILRQLEQAARRRYVPPFATALVYIGLAMEDEALAWLDRAYDAHDVHLLFLTADPKWDPLRRRAAFRTLLERCRFPVGGE